MGLKNPHPPGTYKHDKWIYDRGPRVGKLPGGNAPPKPEPEPEAPASNDPPLPSFAFPEISFEMPELPDYTEMFEKQQELAKQAAGIRDRDMYYEQRMQAANDAINFIDADISQKMSRAKLMGVEYTISEGERVEMVNNYFSTIWSEAHETKLGTLMGEWGDPTGFTGGFQVTRGDASEYEPQDSVLTPISRTKGRKPGPAGSALTETVGGQRKQEQTLLAI